ncbi:MAG: ribonuclease T [Alphaproteobacteria bacterium]|nr:ribonuclease T [Alphaproteobacteria bacterium]
MDGQRIRQVVIGVLILVAFATFWSREVPKRAERSDAPQPSETVTVDTAPAPQEQRQTGGPAIATAAFDYYVLVLSWSPTHCSGDSGRGRDDDLQCRSGRPYGFVLHGLWPQNERGYPENCQTGEPRAVSDAVMNDVLKISPSAQLVQHEWEKHGTCSGLSQADYFATAALAFDAVKVPPAYRAPPRPIVTTPDDVRRAFLDANRSIGKDDLSATCSRNQLAEVWVCLDKDLRARACSNDVRKRHCGARDVRMLAVRGDWPR